MNLFNIISCLIIICSLNARNLKINVLAKDNNNVILKFPDNSLFFYDEVFGFGTKKKLRKCYYNRRFNYIRCKMSYSFGNPIYFKVLNNVYEYRAKNFCQLNQEGVTMTEVHVWNKDIIDGETIYSLSEQVFDANDECLGEGQSKKYFELAFSNGCHFLTEYTYDNISFNAPLG